MRRALSAESFKAFSSTLVVASRGFGLLLQFEPWSGLLVRQIHSNLIGTITGLPSGRLVRTARHFIYDSRELHPVSLRTHFGLVDSVHPDCD